MDKNNSKKQSLFIKLFSRTYVSIKENSKNANLLYFISYMFQLINTILIIDIIFNYKRDFNNVYNFLYFLSPVFYFEILNCKILNKDNATEVNSTRYQYDQIYKLGVDTFKIIPYEQKDFYDYQLIGFIYLICIILFFLSHLIRNNNCFFRILKKICVYLIYITFVPFYIILLLIYNRTLFLQFSDNYNEIDNNFILDAILFILFNILGYIFYTIFIYSYDDNEKFYFLQSKIFISEFSLEELGCFLMVLRLNNQYSILFHLIWSLTYIYNFCSRAKYFKNEIHITTLRKIYFFGRVLIFSMFIVRFISICLINFLNNEKVFKILEGILIILLIFVTFFYLSKSRQYVNLTKLLNDLKNGEYEFFEGGYQLFIPLRKFFLSKTHTNRVLEKNKESFFLSYKEDIKNYFCLSKQDYDVLSGGNDSLISVFTSIDMSKNSRTTTSTTTINNEIKDYNIILTVLISFISNLYKIAKERNDIFGKIAMEVLIYNKVLLYFISDDKTFRATYYLKKFIYSEKYDNSDLLIHFIFKYLIFHFKKVEKKNDENSLEYLIHFNRLNIEYLKIIKSFKQILKSFTKSKKEIIRIIDNESSIIGKSLDEIILLNDKSSESVKIKEQPENEKFKLIEDIMFNANYDKSFEFFDLNSLDSIVDKNNYFLILFQKGSFIVKKAPLVYFQVTGIKTSKLIDNPSINIFPYLMRKTESKYIKSTLLNKKSVKEESVLETSEHYLVAVKLNYNLLPSYNGKLYVVCLLETVHFPNDSNYILMQSNGICIEYGTFFKTYLGFINQIKRLNILSIFGIKDFNPKKSYNQNFNINISEMLLNVKAHLVKDSGWQNSEISSCLKKIKENFQNAKIIKVEFVLKRIFQVKNGEIYLMQVLFNDLKLSVIEYKKVENETIEPDYISAHINGTTITGSTSGSSVLSYKIIKESSWNISSKKKENISLAKTPIDTISFIYNLFLIVLAVVICVLIKIFSIEFYNEYIKMLNLREMNFVYFSSLFYVINMVKLPYSDIVYNQLDTEYKNEIEGYNISLGDYYQNLLQNQAILLSTKNKYFKNNFTNLKKSSKLYPYLFVNTFEILLHDGSFSIITYEEAFDLPKNYFYILSQINGYYLDMPIINYDKIISSITNLSETQQFLLCSMYNFFNFLIFLNDILVVCKSNFKSAFKKYRLLMNVFFLGFLIFNIFSIILLFLSIEITNGKISAIIEKITKLTKRGKNYLEEKLKLSKLIILNEIKCSIVLEKLKEINPNNKVKPSNIQNQIIINSPTREEELNQNTEDDDKDDMYLVKFSFNKKKSKYNFKAYCQTIKTLILLAMVYLIFLAIGFPLIIHFFKKINLKRKETEAVQDLQEIILGYYLDARISICLNDTTLQEQINLFTIATNNLFNNYTETKRLLSKENINETITYMNKINADGYEGCEILLNKDKYYSSILGICSFEPLLQTKVETMISGFVNQLRSEFLSFNQTNRTETDIIYYFHSSTFQFNNLLVIIYFQNYLQDLEYSYILPELQNNINSLTNFLVIIFVIMVITEILYYIGSNIFVLKKISSSLNDYKIMEKFFIYEENPKKN